MFRLTVLVLAVAALASASPTRRGARLRPGFGKIVGGQDTTIQEYPHQISLRYYGSHICGGSIISETFVITAAHCTDGSSASVLTVRAGSTSLSSGGVEIRVRTVNQNPRYDDYNIDFDISVLELSERLTLSTSIQPIGLPSSDVADNTPVDVTGWGTLSEGGGTLPTTLQVVTVNIVNHEECVSDYSGTPYGDLLISERMICAATPQGGKDACQGDSGGPLVADGTLYGIVSWGIGCAEDGYPGVYSSVASRDLRGYVTQITNL